MADLKGDNVYLHWVRGRTPRGNHVVAKCDIPPHTVVLIEPTVACAPYLALPEGHPGMRAFPVDVNYPSIKHDNTYVPIVELVEGLRRTGWTDDTVGGELALLPCARAPKNATPLIRAALANSLEMRCVFSSSLIGEAVCGLTSSIGHSCQPNAVYAFGVCGDITVATGSKTVSKGDFLTISRIGTQYGSTRCTCNRRGLVMRKIGRVCVCSKCTEADSEDNSGNAGATCPDDKCHSALRETANKDVFDTVMKPFSGMTNTDKEFAEISDLWRAHHDEIVETPTFLDMLSRKATLYAPHTRSTDLNQLEVLNEMAQAVEDTLPNTSSTFPEFMRYTNYVHQLLKNSNDIDMFCTMRDTTLDWIRAVLRRFPWMEPHIHEYTLGCTASSRSLPMHISSVWSSRTLSDKDYREGMDREIDGSLGSIARLKGLTVDQLFAVASTIGVDPMQHRGAVTPEDREAFIAAISAEIGRIEVDNAKAELPG